MSNLSKSALSCLMVFGLGAGTTVLAQGASGGEVDGDLPIAIQMFTLRDYAQTFEEQLAFAAKSGYRNIETVGTHGLTAEEMNQLLDEYGVSVVSTHVNIEDLVFNFDEIVAFNKAIGNTNIVLPSSPDPTDSEGWQEIGRILDGYGERFREEGMTFAFHNPDDEMVEIDGKLALDWMLDAADPENLKWQADLAWMERGGQDPAQLLANHAGRVVSVHAKDNYPEGEGEDEVGFTSVGSGVLDWDAVLPAARDAGAQYYIVEHDSPVDYGTVKESFDYLSSTLPGVLGE